MAIAIDAPTGVLTPQPLSQDLFSGFGTVIENPAPSSIPSSKIKQLPPHAVQANQGSALKYLDVTHMKDYYGSAPSKQPGKAVMNMFVCASRSLLPAQTRRIEGYFPVEMLERHPYTTQTFVPLGISPSEVEQARYLVIVAPSLPRSSEDEVLPVPPEAVSREEGEASCPGQGLPDLHRMRAFVANGSQAVTYGAGTWHAPMVVVGTKPIDFVVVQFANGVAIEDCQEAGLRTAEGAQPLSVEVPKARMPGGLWKL